MERIDKLKTFLQASPNDPFLKHALALEYVKLGDEAGARKLFEEILTQDPGYVGSYYHLGKLLERTGERALALEWFEKGLAAAKVAGDRHAYGELQGAYDDLQDN
ncbi:tetratricopeptide repeat protein [Paraflavitalea speifideaquila]|uniref:tetratricopeptide repeat protein n=1 Tax=Paraflavitalea speifideaquila TaxID=3076558 RepID=UPI0028E5384F|nr:tetratricopeptide repeat protein [Paraflavitalea speifideiaquila]